MTDPSTKPARESGELSKTTMAHCQTWVKEQLYGRKKSFTSKYTDKGIQAESDSIELAASHYNWGLVFKNTQIFSNKFMTGTPDVILSDRVVDLKNSWDCFTFPLFTEPDKDYWWQLQGYMALTGKDRASLVYCLSDTPDDIIDRELSFLISNNQGLTEQEYNDAVAHYKYSHIPAKFRLVKFDFTRDDPAIQRIESRVLACREYIKKLVKGVKK